MYFYGFKCYTALHRKCNVSLGSAHLFFFNVFASIKIKPISVVLVTTLTLVNRALLNNSWHITCYHTCSCMCLNVKYFSKDPSACLLCLRITKYKE